MREKAGVSDEIHAVLTGPDGKVKEIRKSKNPVQLVRRWIEKLRARRRDKGAKNEE